MNESLKDLAELLSKTVFSTSIKAKDKPGVLAEIAGVLGRHNISIASVLQHEPPEADADFVPLVIMTHAASAGALDEALKTIDSLPCARPGTIRLRVRD